ncbi:MAG: YcxB family protein [Anaeroplasmataceae bacterium]
MLIKNTSIFTKEEIFKISFKALMRRSFTMVLVLSIMLIVGISFYFIDKVANHFVTEAIFYSLFFVSLFGLFMQIISFATINLKIKRDNNLVADFPYEFHFCKDEIKIKTIEDGKELWGDVSYKWVYKYYFSKQCLYLYQNSTNVYFVRKDGFENPEDYERIQQYIKEWKIKSRIIEKDLLRNKGGKTK